MRLHKLCSSSVATMLTFQLGGSCTQGCRTLMEDMRMTALWLVLLPISKWCVLIHLPVLHYVVYLLTSASSSVVDPGSWLTLQSYSIFLFHSLHPSLTCYSKHNITSGILLLEDYKKNGLTEMGTCPNHFEWGYNVILLAAGYYNFIFTSDEGIILTQHLVTLPFITILLLLHFLLLFLCSLDEVMPVQILKMFNSLFF